MTSTRSSSTNVTSTNAKTRSATRRIEAFRQRFGDGHFYLACHAALPLALTPDLLYSLWANFQRDIHGEAINIPWIAVADLMLSNLCKEVGNELYEMDQAVRDDLLNQLQNDSRFRLERLQALADFVMAYVEQQLDSPDLDVRDLAQGQQWRALAYKNPSEAAHNIATVLAQLPFDDKAEWMRMAALLNSLAEPLAAFQPLLSYIRAMADLARGNLAAATAQMTQAVDANREVRVEGVNLPIPDVLNGTLPKSHETDGLPPSPPNRLRMPVAIAGATITSVLMLIGVQYGLRSPDTPPTPDVTSSATPSPQTSSPPINPRTTPIPKTTPSVSPSVQPTSSSSKSKPSPSSTLLPQSSSTSPKEARPTPSPAISSSIPSPATPSPAPSATTTSSAQATPSSVAPPVTFEQIMQIAPEASPSRVRQLVPYLNQAMTQFGINTRLRQAHFLAQMAHESDRFNALEEYASGEDYEGRSDFGNTQPGDGVRYKGRGLLQIAGRINYAAVGKGLGVDLISNPKRLADPDLASLSAGWVWSVNQLNGAADNDDVTTVTRVIIGGYNGLDDRIQLLQAAKKVFGI